MQDEKEKEQRRDGVIHIERAFVRKDESVWLQPLIACINDAGEHGLVHEEVAVCGGED